MVLTSGIGPDPNIAEAPASALDNLRARAQGIEKQLVRPDTLRYDHDREGRCLGNPAHLERYRLACLSCERGDRIERLAVGGDDLVADPEAGARGRAAVIDASEEHASLQGARHDTDPGVSDAAAGEQSPQTRCPFISSEDVEQLIVGELAWCVVPSVRRSKLSEHRVESRRNVAAGWIGWQGCAVHGTRLRPIPLDRISVVEMPAHEPPDFLDEDRRRAGSLDLSQGTKVQPPQADRDGHCKEDATAQVSASSHHRAGSRIDVSSGFDRFPGRYAPASRGFELGQLRGALVWHCAPGGDLFVGPAVALQRRHPAGPRPASAARSRRSTSDRAPPAAPGARSSRTRSAWSPSRRTDPARCRWSCCEFRIARSTSATGFMVGWRSFLAGLSKNQTSP